MARKLVLDLKGIINEIPGHSALMEKLRSNRLLSNQFLYRGTDMYEVDWLKGETKRATDISASGSEFDGAYDLIEDKNENSVDCYTLEEMEQFLKGGKRKTLIWYALKENLRPIIAVYKANHMEKNYVSHSNNQYTFKDPNKRLEALAAFVELKNC